MEQHVIKVVTSCYQAMTDCTVIGTVLNIFHVHDRYHLVLTTMLSSLYQALYQPCIKAQELAVVFNFCHGCTVYQKLDMSGLFSSKCRHVDREKKRIVQRRSQS